MRRPAPTGHLRTAVVAAFVASLGLASLAASTTTTPTAEAWFQPLPSDGASTPLCDAGIPAPGCAGDGGLSANPYPEGTLHVAVQAGRTEAVTALEIAVPDGDTTQLQLRLPLATAEDGTSVNVASSRFDACPATGVIEDGAEAAPSNEIPPHDCTTSARAIFVADEGTGDAFTVDLRPLADRVADGRLLLVLVPADAAASEGDSWHAAFSRRDRAESTSAPITLLADVRAASPTTPPVTPSPPAQDAPPPPPTLPAPTVVTPPAAAPAPQPLPPPPARDDPPAVAPPAPAPAEEAATIVASPARVPLPVGLVYPGVFAVPLLLVLFAALAVTALARPLPLDD